MGVIGSERRISAQDITVAALVKPLSKVMLEDAFDPIYDDTGNLDKYAGVPKDFHTMFFYENDPLLLRVAAVLAKRSIRRALYRVRIERAIICPWKGSTRATFGL